MLRWILINTGSSSYLLRSEIMNIYGEKVILRAINSADAQMLLKLINDPETEKMLGGSSFPVSLEGQIAWMQNQTSRRDVLRCIVAKADDEDHSLGTIILTDIDEKNGVAQIHIKMEKDNGRGHGYGTDALNTMVKYAFEEMRLNCIYAEVLDYNTPSQRLFEKCGFKKEGILRGRVFKGGKYNNIISYSCLKEG